MIDVVIVGGGPVGLFLACELKLAGVDPVVLERLPEQSQDDKAHGVVGQAVRLLDDRGLYERFGGSGAPEPLPTFFFGTLTLPVHVLGDDNPMFMLQINQRDLERHPRRAGRRTGRRRSPRPRGPEVRAGGRPRRSRRREPRRRAGEPQRPVPRRVRRRPQRGPEAGGHRVPGNRRRTGGVARGHHRSDRADQAGAGRPGRDRRVRGDLRLLPPDGTRGHLDRVPRSRAPLHHDARMGGPPRRQLPRSGRADDVRGAGGERRTGPRRAGGPVRAAGRARRPSCAGSAGGTRGWRSATATGGSSSPATPPTSMPPRAAPASTWGCRTPRTWRGSWQRTCTGGPPTDCSTATSRNAARSASACSRRRSRRRPSWRRAAP